MDGHLLEYLSLFFFFVGCVTGMHFFVVWIWRLSAGVCSKYEAMLGLLVGFVLIGLGLLGMVLLMF